MPTEFPALKVMEGQFTYESDKTPWSAWWYPYQNKEFTSINRNDGYSILQKLDLYASAFHRQNIQSHTTELNAINSSMYDSWSGLCHAWAVASILHPEPKYNRLFKLRYSDLVFSIADQKALLAKSYEGVAGLKMYGTRFNGEFDDRYEDINPAKFHLLLEHHLKNLKKPFLMDYDPSYPVWTVPAYKATTTIKTINRTTVKVITWLTYASSFVESQSFIGTMPVSKRYEYELVGSFSGNQFTVKDGSWTGESRRDHPDYILLYPENITRKSYNKYIHGTMIDNITK